VDQAKKLVSGPLVKEWAEAMRKEKGMRLLALNWYFGPRHIIATSLSAIPKRSKARSPSPAEHHVEGDDPGHGRRAHAAGVGGGLHGARSEGRGRRGGAPLHAGRSRLYEVAKVITLTAHFKAITGMVIGEKFFQSLLQTFRRSWRRKHSEPATR